MLDEENDHSVQNSLGKLPWDDYSYQEYNIDQDTTEKDHFRNSKYHIVQNFKFRAIYNLIFRISFITCLNI